MPLQHRIPALWAAALSSAAFTLCVLAGTGCNLLSIDAEPGNLLLTGNGVELMAVTSGIGVLCKNDFYESGDQMWSLSKIFLYISLSFGGVSVLLAWGIITFLPSELNWRVLSFMAAATAVIQVPIFLVLESTPCSDSKETQTCTLSVGSFYLIGSTACWILVTFCTQCSNPPHARMAVHSVQLPKRYILKAQADDEALEGLREDPEVDAVIEAKATKRTKRGWFSRQIDEDSLELPAVATDPMRDDSFDLESPRSPRDPEDPLRSDGPVLVPFQSQKKANVPANAFPEDPFAAPSSPSRVKTESAYYFPSSSPARASETIRVVGTAESPARKATTGRSPGSGAMTGRDILADLHQGVPDQNFVQPPAAKVSPLQEDPNMGDGERYNIGLRALTKKLKIDSKRRRNRRQRSGYQQMYDDYESDDEPFMSPPIEVKIEPFANFDDVDFSNTLDFTDDEKEELMDDWNQLHKATTAGVRMGVEEGVIDDKDRIDFDAQSDGYHSDPELVYYVSDYSHSLVSASKIQQFTPNIRPKPDDNSTLSSKGIKARDSERSNSIRRRQPPSSPNKSVTSSGGSLLALTINEETDQDILEEVNEDDLYKGYASAPDVRKTTRRQRGRAPQGRMSSSLSQPVFNPKMQSRQKEDDGTLSTNSLKLRPVLLDTKDPVAQIPTNNLLQTDSPQESDIQRTSAQPSHTSPKPIDPPDSTSPPEALVLPRAQSFDKAELNPVHHRTAMPATAPGSRHIGSRSLSPLRGRGAKPMTWGNDSMSVGGINSRSMRLRANDASEHRSQSSNISKRAREFRIKRMQRMKDTNIQDTSNLSYVQERERALGAARARKAAIDSAGLGMKTMSTSRGFLI